MRAEQDPISLSHDQRLRESAAILARGLRRLRTSRDASHESAATSAERISPDSCVN